MSFDPKFSGTWHLKARFFAAACKIFKVFFKKEAKKERNEEKKIELNK